MKKNIIDSRLLLYVELFTTFFSQKTASAAYTKTVIEKKVEVSDFIHLIDNIFEWVLSIAGTIALFMLIYAGIMYITSTGNEEKAKKAKKTFYWTIGGLMLLLLAYSIAFIVNDLFT